MDRPRSSSPNGLDVQEKEWVGLEGLHQNAPLDGIRNRTSLVLADAGLERLNPDVGSLQELRYLDVSNNRLRELPPTIGDLKRLLVLRLTGNSLPTLPAAIGQLERLRELTIRSNSLLRLPETIGALRSLVQLDLSSNGLEELPAAISELEELRALSIAHNRSLRRLPGALGHLSNLRRLEATYCGLSELPPELGSLRQLEELELGGNELTSVPESFSRLGALRTLNLQMNRLGAVPRAILELTNIRDLDLALNPLGELPGWIGGFHGLERLMLAETRLESLPPGIGRLGRLRELDLFNNRLSVLPEEICTLYELRVLGLSGNPLESLPARIGDLVNLRTLMLAETPIAEDPLKRSMIQSMLPHVDIDFGRSLGGRGRGGSVSPAISSGSDVPSGSKLVSSLDELPAEGEDGDDEGPASELEIEESWIFEGLVDDEAENGDDEFEDDEFGDEDDEDEEDEEDEDDEVFHGADPAGVLRDALFIEAASESDIRWAGQTATFPCRAWDGAHRLAVAWVDQEARVITISIALDVRVAPQRLAEALSIIALLNSELRTAALHLDQGRETVHVRVSTSTNFADFSPPDVWWMIEQALDVLMRFEVRLGELGMPGGTAPSNPGSLPRRRQVELELERRLMESHQDPLIAFGTLAREYGAAEDDLDLIDRYEDGGGSMGAEWASEEILRVLTALARAAKGQRVEDRGLSPS